MNDFTYIVWIADWDHIKDTGQTKIFEDIRKRLNRHPNVLILINNPCFEFWLLLHFQQTSRPYNTCNEVIRDLKKYIPGYDKNANFLSGLFQPEGELASKFTNAIENEKSLHQNEYKSSYSEMFKLFELITSFP